MSVSNIMEDAQCDIEIIEEPNSSIILHAGKILIINVKLSGSRPIDLVWYKDGLELAETDRIRFTGSRDHRRLLVFDTDSCDGGNYSLLAFNNTGQVTRQCHVQIKDTQRGDLSPEITTNLQTLYDLQEDRNLEICIRVEGYPEPRLSVYKNDNKLKLNERCQLEYLESGEWMFRLSRVYLRDSGSYYILAQNRFGSCREEFSVHVSTPRIFQEPVPQPSQSTSTEEQESTKQTEFNKIPKIMLNSKVVLADATLEASSDAKPNLPFYSSTKPQGVLLANQFGETSTDEPTAAAAVFDVRKKLVFAEGAPGETDLDAINTNNEHSDAPKPGTIADREHRKWVEGAVHLANNPYSTENLNKYSRKASLSLNELNYMHIEGADNPHRLTYTGPHRIDCGLPTIPTQYKREYVINQPPAKEDTQKRYEVPSISDRIHRLGVGGPSVSRGAAGTRLSKTKSFSSDLLAGYRTDAQRQAGMRRVSNYSFREPNIEHQQLREPNREQQQLKEPTREQQQLREPIREQLVRAGFKSSTQLATADSRNSSPGAQLKTAAREEQPRRRFGVNENDFISQQEKSSEETLVEPIIEAKSNLVGRKVEEDSSEEFEDEDHSRVEDSGLGSASERTPWSEERDEPILSVKERAKKLDERIRQVKEAERLEEEHVWRLSRGRSKDRGAARGHSVENRVPRGHSVDSTSINAHHGGGRVGALSRKPGSVDSLLDWDSDSTRPPSIPPRSVTSVPRVPSKLTAQLTPPPPLPPKTKYSAQKANIVSGPPSLREDTPSVRGGSSESIYSTDLNSYSIEDGYMEDGYILPVNYRDDFNYGMGHPKQSSSYDYLTDQSNSDNESIEEINRRRKDPNRFSKASKHNSRGHESTRYTSRTAMPAMTGAKSTDAILEPPADHQKQDLQTLTSIDFTVNGGQNRLSQSTPSLNVSGVNGGKTVDFDGVAKLPSVRELKSKFLVKEPAAAAGNGPEPAPRKSINKKKLNLTKPSGMNYQLTNISTSSESSHSIEKSGRNYTVQRLRPDQYSTNILNICDDDVVGNKKIDYEFKDNLNKVENKVVVENKISISSARSNLIQNGFTRGSQSSQSQLGSFGFYGTCSAGSNESSSKSNGSFVRSSPSSSITCEVFNRNVTDQTISSKFRSKTNFFGSSISSLYRSQEQIQASGSSIFRSQDIAPALSCSSIFRSQGLVPTASGSSLFKSQDLVPASDCSSLYRSQDDFGYFTGYTAHSNLISRGGRMSSDSLKSFATPESFSSEDNVPMDSSEEMFHQLFVPDRTFDEKPKNNYKSNKFNNDLSQKMPIEAKLVADGVSVIYKAPPPPSGFDNTRFNLNFDKDHFQHMDNCSDEIDEFREKVASASPMRRSETSSMSLGMTWCSSSRDSLLNSPTEGTNQTIETEDRTPSLRSEDYAPQIMTEDCVPSPLHSTESSMASAKYYATYIPDKDLDSEELGTLPRGKRKNSHTLSETSGGIMSSSVTSYKDSVSTNHSGHVSIVNNPYTIFTSNETNTEDTYEADNDSDDDESVHEERAWKSNGTLESIRNWKPKNSVAHKIKYASESNIFDEWDEPLENGLRNIQKDNDFSSCEKSDDTEYSDPSEDECVYYKVTGEAGDGGKTTTGPKPRFSVAGLDDSMAILRRSQHQERFTGYCENVIPEEPSDYEDSWTDPHLIAKHINIIKVENNNNQNNIDQMIKRIHVQSCRAEKQQLSITNPAFNTTNQNLNNIPKKHVTLIRIDSDPYSKTNLENVEVSGKVRHGQTTNNITVIPNNSTNSSYNVWTGAKSHSPTLCSIRVGSVKDLTAVFESLSTAVQSVNLVNQSLVHSLTARSVPNRMKETLKTGWDTQRDSIVRIQTAPQPTERASNKQGSHNTERNNYKNNNKNNEVTVSAGGHTTLAGKVKQVSMMYDNSRGDSPEHTGIPLHPAQLPSRRSIYPARQQDGYTSDESVTGGGAKNINLAGYASDRSATNSAAKYSRKVKHKVSNC